MTDKKNSSDNKSDLAKNEEEVLNFWTTNKIFEQSMAKEATGGDFVFYEGPPTANAKPALHHLEARAFKDVIPRYKTMRGFKVRRKAGWDTHGLPVELQVEKALGLKSKKEIEAYGIEKFNQQCRADVWKFLNLWSDFTNRIGYWLDRTDEYITYNNSYIESVWNILKTTNDKQLLYKDYKVVPWCPRCGTGLSSHELAQGYAEVKDLSVYVKFKVIGQDNTYLLAWTTTPWTLPGNVALAVGEKITYVEIELDNKERLILAKSRLENVLGENKYTVVREMKGSDLVGQSYEPVYPYLTAKFKTKDETAFAKSFKVYPADFVTTEDGTGIVHTAVMYGQDDFELGTKEGLPKFHLVNEDGTFVTGCDFLSGKFVRDEGVAIDIIKDLAHRGLLFKKEKYAHTYPHCWRCKTPLIYYARDSWYIRMSELRDQLVIGNEKINWEPSHIREGRFGEWLREVKDWAISRERYWGTPLPIWQDSEGQITVIGSIDELKQKTKKSGNNYIAMRHGEAENNVNNIVNSDNFVPVSLTEVGKKQVAAQIEALRSKKIDLIFTSPLKRTKDTADMVAEALEIPTVITDDRLKEINTGEFSGRPVADYHNFFDKLEDYFSKTPAGGENLLDVKKRVGDFIYELEQKYQNKNILIISHEYPLWMLFGVETGADIKKLMNMKGAEFIKNAEVRDLDFVPLPHNDVYELDLHRPYIDEVEILNEQGETLTRVKEVADVWLDSGAMPFAQDNYPFSTSDKELLYPADFISEAIDQTRGWFYTLHAVGILMGKGPAYKNVICLGHILDAEGKKMSKSIGNIIEPKLLINKYGVDALRLWMYSVNQPGDSKNFDEKTVDEIVKKVFNLLNNIYTFYNLYQDESILPREDSTNVLDVWIVNRLQELTSKGTSYLDDYKIFEASRLVRDFVSDFSTWYIRRSRDRFKEEGADKKDALATTRFVLLELAKYMAPFTPFFADSLYLKLKPAGAEASVHLTSWPTISTPDEKVLNLMSQTRDIVSVGLEKRASSGIKVRQVLASMSINIELPVEYLALIKDEMNVKEVVVNTSQEEVVVLDFNLTPELQQEGHVRELIRFIQNLRKTNNLLPADEIKLNIKTDSTGGDLIGKFNDDIKKAVGANTIDTDHLELNGEKISIDGLDFIVVLEV